jgi:hypothetical protein
METEKNVNAGILVNLIPLSLYVCTSVALGRVLTNCVALQWVEIGQPCCRKYCFYNCVFGNISRDCGSIALSYENHQRGCCIVQLKCDGTRRRTGGEVKGKLANGVGSQYP